MSKQPEFPGFAKPQYTMVPDEVFDVLLPKLSKAELKVLLYVIRRTLGFGQDSDAISVSQIAEGIVRRDGTRLDHGTGLSRSSVHLATKTLVERGVLNVEKVRDEAGDFDANIYSLRFREGVVRKSSDPSPNSDRGSSENRTTGSPKTRRGVVRKSDTQETDEQQTVDKNVPDEIAKDESELTPAANLNRYREMTPEERLAQFEATQSTLKRLPRLS